MTSRSPSRRYVPVLAIAIAAIGIAGYAAARPDARPSGLLRDFNAFYCAGRAIDNHADPYRSEPLGHCERQPKPAPLLTGARGLVMPAPLPPYAMLPFALLARLPYLFAALLWSAAIVASVAVTALALRRATGAPLLPLVAALALGDGYASLCLGQVAPIAVAALAVSAMLLVRGRDEAAALVAALATIEPHVGLPACVALAVWRKRTRPMLALAAFTCAALSIALAGLPTTVEYLVSVVPAHALSEVLSEKQFSLTYAAHWLGLGNALAVRVGEGWYFAMVAWGIFASRAIAKRTGDKAAFVVVPPALALIGGPFVHIVQMAAALPAAFVLYAHVRGKARRALGLAIVALAIPWIQFANLGTVFVVLAPLAAAILVSTLVDRRPAIVAGAALATLVLVEQFTYALTSSVPDPTAVLLAHYDPGALAESTWMLYVRTIGTVNARAFNLAKIPTLLGLLALAWAALRVALGPVTNVRSGGRRERPRQEAGSEWRIAHS